MRYPSIIISVASLLMACATLALWVRSYWIDDGLRRGTLSGELDLSSSRGQIIFSRVSWRGDDPPPPVLQKWSGRAVAAFGDSSWRLFEHKSWPGEDGWRRIAVIGFVWQTEDGSEENPHTYAPLAVAVPLWFIALLTLLSLLHATRRIRKRWILHRRRAAGMCLVCGYDLRATGERCPECGTAPPMVAGHAPGKTTAL